MDIIIKAFNRPYYLDKCLQSIVRFVSNYKHHTIVVLDDGTPQVYLDKLLEKYPFINIKKSPFYKEKSEYCSSVLQQTNTVFKPTIPTLFWQTEIEKCSTYFLLLEEDMWFTSSVNLDSLLPNTEETNWVQMKLYWLSNPLLISAKTEFKSKNYTLYEPNLPTTSGFWFTHVYDKKYRFKIHKLFTSLGIYSINKWLRFYSVYTVAGVIFHKNYYSYLWQNATEQVNENAQLKKAIQFYKKASHKQQYAHTNKEVLRTGFCSASAPSENSINSNFNVFIGNAILNNAWLNGFFKTDSNFDSDLDKDAIYTLLKNENHSLAKPENWQKFTNQFVNQYTQLGCEIN